MLFLKLLLAKEDPQELLRDNLNLKGWWGRWDLNPTKRGDIPRNSLIFPERDTIDK